MPQQEHFENCTVCTQQTISPYPTLPSSCTATACCLTGWWVALSGSSSQWSSSICLSGCRCSPTRSSHRCRSLCKFTLLQITNHGRSTSFPYRYGVSKNILPRSQVFISLNYFSKLSQIKNAHHLLKFFSKE